MTVSPLVSVLMPVYNAEKYVTEAVESILAQTFQDFEFLIVNDGSTDRSLKILQHYARKDNRIRLTNRSNQGLIASLNELVLQARGEFLARMDADDVAMPERFVHQVEFLRQHPDVVCIGGAQDFIDESGWLLKHHQEPDNDEEIQQFLLWGWTCINHPSAMMRRAAVLQVGKYNETTILAEDLDLWLRLGEVGKLANLKETVLKYRQHQNSVSDQNQKKQLEQMRQVCQRAWQRRGIQGEFRVEPWRPHDRPSRHEYILKYGWSFFNRGQRWAAIVYSIRAIRTLPLKLEGWKLLICALVKPSPSQPLL